MNSERNRSPIVGSRHTDCQQFAPFHEGDTGVRNRVWTFRPVLGYFPVKK
jgi:hypothetical protein